MEFLKSYLSIVIVNVGLNVDDVGKSNLLISKWMHRGFEELYVELF